MQYTRYLHLFPPGSKPFKCSVCNLRFRTSGHRKAHLQSHIQGSKGVRGRKRQQALCIPEEMPINEVEQILTHQIITVRQYLFAPSNYMFWM